jgi:DNA-binding SARP family transcriptional activator
MYRAAPPHAPPGTPVLSLNLLGPPALVSANGPVSLSPSVIMLYAYLALAPREGRPRSIAAAQLFADCSERLARRRLNTTLWRLKAEVRSSTGLDVVASTDPRTVALNSAVDVTTDAAVFQKLVNPVLNVVPAALDDKAVARLETAVTLRRGRLVETCHDDWILAARYHIDNLYLTTLDYLIQHHGARGDVSAVTAYGERALELEPLREDLHRHLISAYGAAGRIDLAERQFERCRAYLLEELGAEPMPETIATYSRLRVAGISRPMTMAALVAELERARQEVVRLIATVDGVLEQLRDMQ